MKMKTRLKKRASHSPNWMVDIAASKGTDPQQRKRFRTHQLGKLGAASEVRIIMKDGKHV